MKKHARFLYQPLRPLGKNNKIVTGCNAHWRLCKEAAAEGTVLLKNAGVLPLNKGTKLTLFGLGAGDFIFGGGGSGVVVTDRTVTLHEGLQAAAKRGEIDYFSAPAQYYYDAIKALTDAKHAELPTVGKYSTWRRQHQMELPELPENIYNDAKKFGGTALFCISRYSAEGDNSGDRTGLEGDFTLWANEKALLDKLCKDFENVVVILNTCGPVATKEFKDNDRIGAVLYPMYSGGVAGEALCEMLLGQRYPSGHLQDTLAEAITDYPSTAEFHTEQCYVNYTEDIFVGYRYFETFAPEKVVYPFGYGLGYTTFDVTAQTAALEKNTVKVAVSVKNTGTYPGKEVVQLYLTAPQGVLGKAKKVLTAFAKTKELKPGESQTLKLSFDIRNFASFDDLGKLHKSAFILEKGDYTVSMGTNVRDSESCLTFTLEKDNIVRKCHSYMAPRALPQRLCADGSYEKLPAAEKKEHRAKGRLCKESKGDRFPYAKALEENRLEELVATLSDDELCELLYGHPMTNGSNTNGIGHCPRDERQDVRQIPLVPTADGPAGLRIRGDRGSIPPTFFPCATIVAQSWNLNLAKRLGAAGAAEVKENNVGIWLTPALNIHRNPLCGRNFEYYSEDPLTSGLFAIATVKGIQSMKISACVKHFCANNRENHRRLVDSRVSERALREIYLRGFEIVVKKGDPWMLMTSYNPVNGEQSSKNWEAINGILRGEWGYDGVVCTDWRVLSNLEEELHAGSDVKMPFLVTDFYENAHEDNNFSEMMATGKLSRAAATSSARRVLTMIGKLD
nr:glycoside hydrolase family 3 C-terminal domain-containing protein [Oscillospiraceae bacterium]